MKKFLCNLLQLARKQKKNPFLQQRRQADSAGSCCSAGSPERKLHKKILWCAIMVMVLQQDIPADNLIHYRRSLIPAVDPVSRQYGTRQFGSEKYGPPESLLYKNKYGDNYYHGRPYGTELYPHLARATTAAQMSFTRKRMPHFWPRMRNDSLFSPSKAQREVRAAFEKCVDCFNIQPYSGGVEPPEIGPRNRSWWYDQAGPSGLWYYNYFIQQSWWSFFTNILPDWCVPEISFAVYLININQITPQIRIGASDPQGSANAAWDQALERWSVDNFSWPGYANTPYHLNFLYEDSPGAWRATTRAVRGYPTVDLTAYSPTEWGSALLVVKPNKGIPPPLGPCQYYYNPQGWPENEYTILKDLTPYLGAVWTSSINIATQYAPYRPPEGFKAGYNGWLYVFLYSR